MRTQLPFALLAAAFACSLLATPAQAQRARVFVASYGNDANPCTFGSPCKTFQQAVNVVAGGGEVTAIDSAGFGPINITKAVTITSPDGVEAGIVPVSGGDAITISAGSSDVIQLHGLTLDGTGGGVDGIVFTTGQSLIIAGCVIRDFTSDAIHFNPGASSTLRISDTLLDNNGDAGIYLVQTGSSTVTVAVDRVQASNNHNGLVLQGSNQSTAMLSAVIADSVAANNVNDGFAAVAEGGATGGTTGVLVVRSVAANNGGAGVESQGNTATLWVSQSAVTGNVNGWVTNFSGTLLSYGDNKIVGNAANQSAPPPITNK